MQLNVLKKAYTAKSSKSSQRSNESLDQVIYLLIKLTYYFSEEF